MAYMKDASGVKLDTVIVATEDDIEDLQASIDDLLTSLEDRSTGIGILAYAENASGQATTINAAAVADGFCIVDFEPTERDAWVNFEAAIGIAAAPGVTYGGSLDVIVWEMTMVGNNPTATEVYRQSLDVAAGRPVKTLLGVAHGSFRVGPTTTVRQYALGAGLTKDNASGTLQGQIRHQTTQKSWINVEAK